MTFTASARVWSWSSRSTTCNNQIPPVKGKDNKEHFVSIFFDHLLRLNLVADSQTLKRFITEAKYQKEKIDSSDPDKEAL